MYCKHGNETYECPICIEGEVEQWLAKNPGAPDEVVSFLKRKPDEYPPVTVKSKRNYMRSHAFVKQLVEHMAKAKVTKVRDLKEAMDITLDDIKKESN